jgi:hypothetical protein
MSTSRSSLFPPLTLFTIQPRLILPPTPSNAANSPSTTYLKTRAKRVVDHLPDNEASTIDYFRPLVLTVGGILEKDAEGFLKSWRRHMKKSVYDYML